MSVNSRAELLQTEEQHKENVYRQFDTMRKTAGDSVENAQAGIDKGAYDDQEAFMMHGVLNGARQYRHETETLIRNLYRRPYFAHIEAKLEDYTDNEHYFLSDCESLDQTVRIGSNGTLVPFKQDRKRPISLALFHCYQTKKGDPIEYKAPGGTFTLIPQRICDDDIDSRKLIDAVQLFPGTEMLQITADELLEEKLQENRNNPALRNIIATLQRMQFEIIEADADLNFVVQGCAGSGKSQCLLPRLFFLRDALSQEGWNHILLLTPTQLFRNYSSELIRRYQLSDIENCSIAYLYRTLLNSYDVRFKNRQYQYELSEEYLPDEYLREVYNNSVIAEIDSEISMAIRKYVEAGCVALGIDVPARITNTHISGLVNRLDEEMKAFDERESVLQQDDEYAEKRKQYEELQRKMDNLQKRKDRLQDEYSQIIEDSKQLEGLQQALNEAEQERTEWLEQREADRSVALQTLRELEYRWNNGNDIQMPARYAQQLFIVQDILWGERFRADEEYARFLDEYCSQARDELQAITKSQTRERTTSRQEKRKETISRNLEQLEADITSVTTEIEEYAEWLRTRSENDEGEKSRRTLRRAEMERARYFLSRIESAVFEREVWNALAPLKERYHIQTLQIEVLKDGHQKETRILYKSDLLFYLKIYAALYPDAVLPDYRLICVDEGQDLHKADYDMLHRLYPKAVFNVFGDTEQVLHTACGIHDWQSETGIRKLYSLNKNYRNTAAIVEFCNQTFKPTMEYIGKVRRSDMPHKVSDPMQMKAAVVKDGIVVIVRDRNALERFCASVGKPVSDFEYLDTKAEAPSGRKIPCYSIFAAKGLEFRKVVVFPLNMTVNQKVVACTRAMEELYYYE